VIEVFEREFGVNELSNAWMIDNVLDLIGDAGAVAF
jgi:hypothetical protein